MSPSVPGSGKRAAPPRAQGGNRVTGYASVEWSSAQVETPRLLLRPLRAHDLDELRHEAESRPWLPSDGTGPAGGRGRPRAAGTARASGRRRAAGPPRG